MSEPLRLGVAGLGTVGSALIQLVHNKQNMLADRCGRTIRVTGMNARTAGRDRGFSTDGMKWFDNPADLAVSDDIDVFVELMGGEDEPALGAVKAALSAGKHVVTANKALLAKHGVELALLAEENGVLLNCEAAVAGGIPIIKVMRESLTANAVTRVFGILNGTCNYILTRMEAEGMTFEDCLADAQKLGYAEADPTFDIEGNDTAHKLAILASLAFGTQIAGDAIYLEGITKITIADIEAAKEMGYRIKLLGVATRTAAGVESRVHPAMVPLGSAIAEIGGVTNAVAIEADTVGSLMMSGPGAGGDATASAVAGDICDIAKSKPGRQHGPVLGQPANTLVPHERSAMTAHSGGYFLRLNVVDKPGTMASIATRFAEHDISLESIVQKRGATDDGEAPIVLVTHETSEEAIGKALAGIQSDGRLLGEAQMIRIEKLNES
ncbi:homoserine dehydrogenase [Ahrensia sp. R2A130]|uniref:homoserine dehydrogenase n=1 Tax=Ahrensia sp. R2A130 TaxID=744979 RepID=UPI0001E08C1C|nr:homoserine dehydrogenase [Ahrensia sp. R2A130]EFL90555.1 homoserine dehydrogenase [Ahrensia sp. R2A130]